MSNIFTINYLFSEVKADGSLFTISLLLNDWAKFYCEEKNDFEEEEKFFSLTENIKNYLAAHKNEVLLYIKDGFQSLVIPENHREKAILRQDLFYLQESIRFFFGEDVVNEIFTTVN